jgi:hypothetical protein
MKRILKEPLVHFLLLGAMIFGAYSLLSQRSSTAPDEIVVTMGQVEHLATGFARTWQRPPTPQELAGLVADRVREDVYYREAMALGLDKDDTIIRRRLRQKMEFISDDIAAQTEPTEADLNAYLSAHPDAFRTEPRYSFSQVYLNPDRHGGNLAIDTAQLLTQLNGADGKTDAGVLGDSTLLNEQFTNVSASEVASQFGRDFAGQLSKLSPGGWQGPVASGYGVHLVLVSERTEARLPALAEVRDAVHREWENARRLEANEAFYQELLKRYTVTIEGLEAAQGQLAVNGMQ